MSDLVGRLQRRAKRDYRIDQWNPINIFTEAVDRIEELEQKYYELIYAVENKFPNETRHETALRYIKACEIVSDCTAKGEAITQPPEKE